MKRTPKAKRALANEIADAIQLGDYRPGEWLRQIDLEQKFNATRFDVRAALDELVVRKAIQHVPNRGYRVPILDEAALNDIREVRIVLECATATRIVANVTAPAIAQLKTLAGQFSQTVKSGTRADQSRTNRAFHRLLYSLAGNPVMEETIWSLRERSRGTAMTVWHSLEAIMQSDREHFEIVKALERRSAERLAAVIARHIDRDRKILALPANKTARAR